MFWVGVAVRRPRNGSYDGEQTVASDPAEAGVDAERRREVVVAVGSVVVAVGSVVVVGSVARGRGREAVVAGAVDRGRSRTTADGVGGAGGPASRQRQRTRPGPFAARTQRSTRSALDSGGGAADRMRFAERGVSVDAVRRMSTEAVLPPRLDADQGMQLHGAPSRPLLVSRSPGTRDARPSSVARLGTIMTIVSSGHRRGSGRTCQRQLKTDLAPLSAGELTISATASGCCAASSA